VTVAWRTTFASYSLPQSSRQCGQLCGGRLIPDVLVFARVQAARGYSSDLARGVVHVGADALQAPEGSAEVIQAVLKAHEAVPALRSGPTRLLLLIP
jgi:hypothetical protein